MLQAHQVILRAFLVVDIPGHRVEAATVKAIGAVMNGGLLQLQQQRPGFPILGLPFLNASLNEPGIVVCVYRTTSVPEHAEPTGAVEQVDQMRLALWRGPLGFSNHTSPLS